MSSCPAVMCSLSYLKFEGIHLVSNESVLITTLGKITLAKIKFLENLLL